MDQISSYGYLAATPHVSARSYEGFTMAESVALMFFQNDIVDDSESTLTLDASQQNKFSEFMTLYKNKLGHFNKKNEQLVNLTKAIWKKTLKHCPMSGEDIASYLIDNRSSRLENSFFFTSDQRKFLQSSKLLLPSIKETPAMFLQ